VSQLNNISNKHLSLEKLLSKLPKWKKEGNIVFTNGCFDILHPGHLYYLEKASKLGHMLIIGLNTDESITRLKGIGRPINDEHTRIKMLANLAIVDAIVLFEEDTPYELIKYIIPDVLVKGSDYRIEEIVGYDVVLKNGGSVIPIDLLEGYSTTSIIEKIQNGED